MSAGWLRIASSRTATALAGSRRTIARVAARWLSISTSCSALASCPAATKASSAAVWSPAMAAARPSSIQASAPAPSSTAAVASRRAKRRIQAHQGLAGAPQRQIDVERVDLQRQHGDLQHAAGRELVVVGEAGEHPPRQLAPAGRQHARRQALRVQRVGRVDDGVAVGLAGELHQAGVQQVVHGAGAGDGVEHRPRGGAQQRQHLQPGA